MNKLRRSIQEMTQDAPTLVTIFLSTLLATCGNSAFLNWAIPRMGEMDWGNRIVLTVASTCVYCAIITLSFYLFLPQERKLALKRRIVRK